MLDKMAIEIPTPWRIPPANTLPEPEELHLRLDGLTNRNAAGPARSRRWWKPAGTMRQPPTATTLSVVRFASCLSMAGNPRTTLLTSTTAEARTASSSTLPAPRRQPRGPRQRKAAHRERLEHQKYPPDCLLNPITTQHCSLKLQALLTSPILMSPSMRAQCRSCPPLRPQLRRESGKVQQRRQSQNEQRQQGRPKGRSRSSLRQWRRQMRRQRTPEQRRQWKLHQHSHHNKPRRVRHPARTLRLHTHLFQTVQTF